MKNTQRHSWLPEINKPGLFRNKGERVYGGSCKSHLSSHLLLALMSWWFAAVCSVHISMRGTAGSNTYINLFWNLIGLPSNQSRQTCSGLMRAWPWGRDLWHSPWAWEWSWCWGFFCTWKMYWAGKHTLLVVGDVNYTFYRFFHAAIRIFETRSRVVPS